MPRSVWYSSYSWRSSYRDLLAAASATDELRVVDGELDNEYAPEGTPIQVGW